MSQQPESLDQIIHKEKEAKRKLKVKGQLPIGLKDNRTIGSGYHTSQASIAQEVEVPPDNSKTRNTAAQLKNFEIDQYLYELVDEGIIIDKFVPFYASACHKLGLATVNRLKIGAYNGREPSKLFAYKVKGALQLYYKQEFEKL